jgi:SnoaL-like domain
VFTRSSRLRERWLMDMAELRQIPQRYARAVDARSRTALAELFDPDGYIDGTRGRLSAGDYVDALSGGGGSGAQGNGPEKGMHFLSEPVIDLAVGGAEARLDTYGFVLQVRESSPDESCPDRLVAMRYLDLVRLRSGKWMISHRTSIAVCSSALGCPAHCPVTRTRAR